MVGRPRKIGKRKPCGRLVQTYHNPRAQVSEQPHRMLVAPQFREWPEASTYFGRMMIQGIITPAQHEAGTRYAAISEAFRRAIDSPAVNISAMAYEPRIAGKGDGMPDKAVKRACEAYDAAYKAIENVGWQQAVMHHAVHDKPVTTDRQREFLRCGLDRLVKHLGIDSRLQISRSAKYMVQTGAKP